MSALVVLLLPFVRLAGHSLASSLGFVGIALITVFPVHSVQLLSKQGMLHNSYITLLELVEGGILILDIALLVFVVILYSGVFAVEQWRAVKHILKPQSQ